MGGTIVNRLKQRSINVIDRSILMRQCPFVDVGVMHCDMRCLDYPVI